MLKHKVSVTLTLEVEAADQADAENVVRDWFETLESRPYLRFVDFCVGKHHQALHEPK